MTIKHKLYCKVCGQPFEAVRRDARACSPACRQRLYRSRLRKRAMIEQWEIINGAARPTKKTSTAAVDQILNYQTKTRLEFSQTRFETTGSPYYPAKGFTVDQDGD